MRGNYIYVCLSVAMGTWLSRKMASEEEGWLQLSILCLRLGEKYTRVIIVDSFACPGCVILYRAWINQERMIRAFHGPLTGKRSCTFNNYLIFKGSSKEIGKSKLSITFYMPCLRYSKPHIVHYLSPSPIYGHSVMVLGTCYLRF